MAHLHTNESPSNSSNVVPKHTMNCLRRPNDPYVYCSICRPFPPKRPEFRRNVNASVMQNSPSTSNKTVSPPDNNSKPGKSKWILWYPPSTCSATKNANLNIQIDSESEPSSMTDNATPQTTAEPTHIQSSPSSTSSATKHASLDMQIDMESEPTSKTDNVIPQTTAEPAHIQSSHESFKAGSDASANISKPNKFKSIKRPLNNTTSRKVFIGESDNAHRYLDPKSQSLAEEFITPLFKELDEYFLSITGDSSAITSTNYANIKRRFSYSFTHSEFFEYLKSDKHPTNILEDSIAKINFRVCAIERKLQNTFPHPNKSTGAIFNFENPFNPSDAPSGRERKTSAFLSSDDDAIPVSLRKNHFNFPEIESTTLSAENNVAANSSSLSPHTTYPSSYSPSTSVRRNAKLPNNKDTIGTTPDHLLHSSAAHQKSFRII